jgi:cobalamin transport system substrate-binding protein
VIPARSRHCDALEATGYKATDPRSGRPPAAKTHAHKSSTSTRLSQETCPRTLRANCSPRERRGAREHLRISSCSTLHAERSAGAFFLSAFRSNTAACLASTRLRLSFSLLLQTLLLAILGLSVSSCSSARTPPTSARTVTDELGRNVQVPFRPQRIVSLAPSVTEILFALGAGDRVIGVTSYCDYPPEAREKQAVGDTLKPGIEKIIAIKADLVIISTASQVEASFRRLEELGIAVYVTNPRSIDGVIESVEKLGDLIDAPERTRQLTSDLRGRINTVETRVAGAAHPSVLVILGTEPLITVGARSFINDLVNRAGAHSISATEEADYPQYSMETVIAKQPEIILLQGGGNDLTPRLRQTPAARANRVYHIDDDLLLRPGPRIVEGLEQLAAKVHPELFGARSAEN